MKLSTDCLTPSPEIGSWIFAPSQGIPNHSKYALLRYSKVFRSFPAALPEMFECLFDNHSWPGAWRNGVFDYHHFHSTAHEVLGLANGTACVLFGGEGGTVLELSAGDVVVIPAGVGHKALEASRDLLVVGSYPADQMPDLQRAMPGEGMRFAQQIASVPDPVADPIYGLRGPLLSHWKIGE